MKMKKIFVTTLLASLITLPVYATPYALVMMPSTDFAPQGQTHLDIDTLGNNDGTNTSYGLTWGFKNGEIGLDYLPGDDPVFFNLKLGLVNEDKFKLVAGVQNWGSDANNIALKYVVASQTIDNGTRFSLGYGVGRKAILGDDEKVVMVGIDKMLSDKLWGAVDYISGDSALGAVSFGVSYAVAPNASVLLGYVIPNEDSSKNMFTTQVDINF